MLKSFHAATGGRWPAIGITNYAAAAAFKVISDQGVGGGDSSVAIKGERRKQFYKKTISLFFLF